MSGVVFGFEFVKKEIEYSGYCENGTSEIKAYRYRSPSNTPRKTKDEKQIKEKKLKAAVSEVSYMLITVFLLSLPTLLHPFGTAKFGTCQPIKI